MLVLTVVGGHAIAQAADEAKFFRGLNLNGPSLVIDGNAWEGLDSKHYECRDKAFENQGVPLIPPTDAQRAKMIRSSRWGGNDVTLIDLPNGVYTVYLYVWEDNDPESFDISLNGKVVASQHNSGRAGTWKKLGPWTTHVSDEKIRLKSKGGAANFSGVELWQGKRDESPTVAQRPEDIEFFEKRIRPVLASVCYECHSAGAKKVGGGLLLDTQAGWKTGGESGSPIVPGDPKNSLLAKVLRHDDDAVSMPPDKKLPAEVIADFETWIKRGAADPRDGSELLAKKRAAVQQEATKRWSFQPPAEPPLPAVQQRDWPQQGTDRFLLARMEAARLKPSPDVDRRTLVRRVTYDLTGLPPAPEEVEAFVADPSPDAFERVVDRLLAAPQYGERWGRHWLDVVRYADTAGDNSDFPIPQMYLYRNWVIAAFNRDLPYDQFVREQLAGDLLTTATDNDAQRQQRIVATGYIANARRFGSRVDDYPQHLTIEDTIDNLGRAFLGLTINCARCHDHKFDPISTEDYYGLYGIFQSTRYPWPGIELEQKQRDLVPLAPPDEAKRVQQTWRTKQAELDQAVQQLERERDQAGKDRRDEFQKKIEAARKLADAHNKTPPSLPVAYAVAEAKTVADAHVQHQGNPDKTGTTVKRRFPLALGGQQLAADDRSSGRRSLAEWIAQPQNPLTARVLVNRLWSHHFGRGLVATPNDFGKQGRTASHPELLDWLARRFITSGWSIKELHRELLLSRAYQQGSIHDPASIPGDPANDLLSGFRPRRLDAEALRDTLLSLGENLDATPGGPHPFPPMSDWKFTQHNPFKAVYETNRRSVYLMTQRIQRHPYLAIFDGADPSASTPVRLTSTTPLQALFLFNDPFVYQQAERLAARLVRETPEMTARIDRAYRLLLARPPHEGEVQAARDYLAQAEAALADEPDAARRAARAWQSYVRSLLLLNEFVYLD